MDRYDRRMPELGDATSLAKKAIDVCRRADIARARYLDRHGAVELGITSPKDCTEGAHAECIDDLEAAYQPLARSPGRRRLGIESKRRTAARAENVLGWWFDNFDWVSAMGAV
jgi:hypothetical protein